jgi:hypothetical protein
VDALAWSPKHKHPRHWREGECDSASDESQALPTGRSAPLAQFGRRLARVRGGRAGSPVRSGRVMDLPRCHANRGGSKHLASLLLARASCRR